MALERYKKKRDFTKTQEPEPNVDEFGSGSLKFVIQRHTATRLHYDLRLECDGVLLSWAVPKGPSFNPKDKRLAVHVEDHPSDYASFEGVIPKGEYGGGEVIVWDEGTYSPDEKGVLLFDNRKEAQKQVREGLTAGKLSITLRGHKLQGSWALVRTKDDDNWLLIKHKDEFANETKNALEDERSAISGLTNQDLKEGKRPKKAFEPAGLEGASWAALPATIKPMVPTEVPKAFTSAGWSFEIKLDGIRAMSILNEGKVKILSRNGLDITYKFPALAATLQGLPFKSLIVDGEVVIYDGNGVPSFQGLMQRFQLTDERELKLWDQRAPVEYCVFDVLYVDGWDLRNVPFSARRKVLEDASLGRTHVRVMDSFPEQGELVYEHAQSHGFEGIIGKRTDSKYRDGARSDQWVKVKGYHSEEFVIGGYTKGEGTRSRTFGALLLGEYVDGKLVSVGSVGGGFSDNQLDELFGLFAPDKVDKGAFDTPVIAKGKIQWLKPTYWAEVRFMARTKEGRLRFPIFKRLRPDLPNASPIPQVSNVETTESNEADSILEQLLGDRNEIKLKVEGHELRLSNLSKELWPAEDGQPAGTKRDLISYYAKAGDTILPHLRDRPLALKRFPSGIHGEAFFQKHWEHKLPEFVETVEIWSGSNKESGEYMLCNNLATLIWFAQIGTLEIHPWYSRVNPAPDAEGKPTDFASSDQALDESVLSYPDFMVFDLDPYIYSGKEKKGDEPELNRKAFDSTVEAAMELKKLVDALNIHTYLKTSGKTGLHIYVPIKRTLIYETVRSMAEQFGRALMKQIPGKITMDWSVEKRPGKVFFDHNMNVRGKTLVSIYSTRPQPGAPVSFPVTWEELPEIYPTDFTIHTVPAILAKRGDIWNGILNDRQDMAKILGAVADK